MDFKKKKGYPGAAVLAQQVYSGKVTPKNLPLDVYVFNGTQLKGASEKALKIKFSEIDYKTPNFKRIEACRTNIWKFSAAKTFHQVVQMNDALIQDNKIIPFADFKEKVAEINDKFNDTWLETEYNTAFGQSQMIEQWARFEEQADILPYLQYVTSSGEATCDICEPCDNVTLPVDDEFWDEHTPLQHFNCFPKGTKILSDNGWVNIEDVQKGDLVIGGSSEKRNVIGIHIKDYSGELIQITTKYGSTSATPNHRFLTLRGWVRAENISTDDVLIQSIKVSFFNKIIGAINNSITIFRKYFMPFKLHWESTTVTAFDNNIKGRDEYINKKPINMVVENNINTSIFKIIAYFCLMLCGWSFVHGIFSKVIITSFLAISYTPFFYFLDKHWIVFFHSIRGINIFNAKPRMRNRTDNFLHIFRSKSFPFIIINPLQFNSFGFITLIKSKLIKYGNKLSALYFPSFTNVRTAFKLCKVELGEGFDNGFVLNRFNSINNFLRYSIWHNKIILVKNIAKVTYNGNIYNISVEKDESYCTKIAVVHNCECLIIQVPGEEAKITSANEADRISEEITPLKHGMFMSNTGKSGIIFNKETPYFNVPKQYENFAAHNFNLPLPKKN